MLAYLFCMDFLSFIKVGRSFGLGLVELLLLVSSTSSSSHLVVCVTKF